MRISELRQRPSRGYVTDSDKETKLRSGLQYKKRLPPTISATWKRPPAAFPTRSGSRTSGPGTPARGLRPLTNSRRKTTLTPAARAPVGRREIPTTSTTATGDHG